MQNEQMSRCAAAALSAALLLMAPAVAAAGQQFSIDFPEAAATCADVQVRSSGPVSRAAERFTITKSEAPVLAIAGGEHGHIRVRGWDRPEYAVEACKFASAGDQSGAEGLLRGITVTRNGSRFETAGPSTTNETWLVVYIVSAPRGASLDLETRNGPISAAGVDGLLKARAHNGPLAIRDCSGTVDASTVNGPISFTGRGGDVKLATRNGPLSLTLTDDEWNGAQLDGRTGNGPLSLTMPDTFRTGVRLESTGHGPLNCGVAACRNARTDATGQSRTLELNGGSATIRVTTANGPISVKPSGVPVI